MTAGVGGYLQFLNTYFSWRTLRARVFTTLGIVLYDFMNVRVGTR